MIFTPRTNSAVARNARIATYLLGAMVLMSVSLAVLPSRWIGTPYLSLANRLNPGIDAPDNWAMAFTYFVRIAVGLTAGAGATAVFALYCERINRRKPRSPSM